MSTLVQSRIGGSASGSVAGHGNITTTAAGFSNPTTAGNLLLMIVYTKSIGTGIVFDPPVIASGYSRVWQSIDNAGSYLSVPSGNEGGASIYFIDNAPSMSILQTTTIRMLNQSASTSTLAIEFDLYEWSGIVVPLVVELTIPPDPFTGVINSDVGGTPNVNFTAAGSVPTINTNLMLVAMSAVPGINLTAGSGYTLGINASAATLGQFQYQSSAPPGQTSATFNGTVPSDWGIVAIAFKDGPAAIPILQVATLTLSFMAAEGGTNPDDQNVAIANGNGGTLSWTVATDQAWLTGLPLSGTDAGVVTASVDITGLVAGTYTGHLTFTAAGATSSPQIVTVTLTVSAPTTDLSVTPLSLSFDGTIGAGNPPDQFATVSNVGTPGAMNFTTASSTSWLTVVPSFDDAGTIPIQLTISVDITTLTEGSYNGTITVTAVGAIDSPQHIAIALTVAAPTPPPSVPVIISSTALTQVDTWELDNGMTEWGTDTGTPYAWHETTLPQQQIAIAPTPDDVGQIGLLYVALAAVLYGTGVALTVPDDWTPYILWGTLGELLGSDGPSYDPVRAQYCTRRFEEGVELARLVLGG